jgi:hypothetical protein
MNKHGIFRINYDMLEGKEESTNGTSIKQGYAIKYGPTLQNIEAHVSKF